jgi:hypothetical protein
MMNYSALFVVRAEFFNIIYMSFGFKGLIQVDTFKNFLVHILSLVR